MGFSIRKKVAGFNTSFQKRGLRVQKQIGLGPFRFNVGTYLGGTHHGRITGRTSAGTGWFRWQKEQTLNGSSSSTDYQEYTDVNEAGRGFNTDDLSEVFDVDEEHEDTTPFFLTQIGVLLINFVLFIAQIMLFSYFPLQIWTLLPVYAGLLLNFVAMYISPYFSMFIGTKSFFVYIPMIGWAIVMQMALFTKTYLIY